VIGVAKDIRGALLGHSDSRFVYLPLPRERWNDAAFWPHICLRGAPRNCCEPRK
jgi:hypothetical protein